MQHKLVSRLFFSVIVLSSVSVADAQYNMADSTYVGPVVPFRKGNWEVQTRKNLWGNKMDEKQDDQDLGSTSRFNLNIETHYWWNKNWAAGIELNYDARTQKNGSELKTHDYSVLGHLTYGINMKNNWGIYFRGGAGVGAGKTEFTQGTSSQEAKSDVFIYKFEVGAPIHVNRQLYFNPNFGYKSISTDYEGDAEQDETRFRLGIGFVSYLNCGEEMWQDNQPKLYDRRYANGVSYLGVHAMGDYSFGNTESIFSGQTTKSDVNRFNLKFDYVYYVIPNLGVGADLGFRSMVTESEDTDPKSTRTNFIFAPKIVYNLPTRNWLNDMFVTFGGGIGSEKEEVSFSGNTNTLKDNVTQFNGGLGYNIFMSRSSMFTLSLGYESKTFKNNDTDQKRKESGVVYELGFRTAIGIDAILEF